MPETAEVTLTLPGEVLDAIAIRAARLVAEEILDAERNAYEGYLPPAAAAHYVGATSRQRIYQLTSAGVLEPDGRDGRTPLYTRETLDAYVRSQAG